MEAGDYVLYEVVTDDSEPIMMVGRSLEDISKACNEWSGVITKATYIMDVHYITEEAVKYTLE